MRAVENITQVQCREECGDSRQPLRRPPRIPMYMFILPMTAWAT